MATTLGENRAPALSRLSFVAAWLSPLAVAGVLCGCTASTAIENTGGGTGGSASTSGSGGLSGATGSTVGGGSPATGGASASGGSIGSGGSATASGGRGGAGVAGFYCSIHSTQWAGWFQVKQAAGAKFDYCAVSHYPMWQGNVTTALAGQLQSFAQIGCKVLIVETGGYYRTAAGQLTWPYAFTEDGQLQFMTDVKTTVAASPGCVGMAYWGTCWSQASAWAPEIATAWDETASRALFDDNAQATPAMDGWR